MDDQNRSSEIEEVEKRLRRRRLFAICLAWFTVAVALVAAAGYGVVVYYLPPIEPIEVTGNNVAIGFTMVGELAKYSGPLLIRIGGFAAVMVLLRIALQMHRYHLLTADALATKIDTLTLGKGNSQIERHYAELLATGISFQPTRDFDSALERAARVISQTASAIWSKLGVKSHPPD